MHAYERGTGFLLARMGSLAARSWTAFLAAHDLTQGQYAVLVTLDEHGPQGQRRLAGLVAVDARNLVAVLDSLAGRGLVERRPDEADKRRRTVALTEQGRTLVKAIAEAAAGEQDAFLRPLDGTERAQLNRLLRRLYESHVEGT
ncbi:MarR family winged helix-turn-helix transcriptional regulator [Actinomadura sp. NTSP31]|uniref:MarR family winged helix-turn-helix transcriptional regulator n=1 Tax=Actinomadura sp. NTSP31 TaxID=1735447 RepID=UPI0035C09234